MELKTSLADVTRTKIGKTWMCVCIVQKAAGQPGKKSRFGNWEPVFWSWVCHLVSMVTWDRSQPLRSKTGLRILVCKEIVRTKCDHVSGYALKGYRAIYIVVSSSDFSLSKRKILKLPTKWHFTRKADNTKYNLKTDKSPSNLGILGSSLCWHRSAWEIYARPFPSVFLTRKQEIENFQGIF